MERSEKEINGAEPIAILLRGAPAGEVMQLGGDTEADSFVRVKDV